MFKQNHNYLVVLLLVCIFSRIATSVYYIEDIDSLRFALSIQDYDILSLQPHFPGYPVFCFLAKILHFIFGNMGASFSIIGGVSIFFIVYYLLRIFNANLKTYEGQYIALIIFFNPLFWIMSNRYMPDLMGLSIALSALYYLIYANKQGRHLEKGLILSGLLAGVRLSYIPLLLIPIWIVLYNHKDRIRLSFYLFFAVLIWFIPLVFITGFSDLFVIAQRHTVGHFMDYGGTIFTEQSFSNRFIYLLRSIWADGFGGYWSSRGLTSVILTVLLLVQFRTSFKDLKTKWNSDNCLRIFTYCVVIYFVWILLFQNVIFKSRHILPILLFFCILLIHGQEKYRGKAYSVVIYVYFIILIGHDLTLISQHKNYTAIHKLKNYISENDSVRTVISIPLINYYLERHEVNAEFINAEDTSEVKHYRNKIHSSFGATLMIGDYRSALSDSISFKKDTTFYHNPYMNQMWSKIQVYSLNKDEI